MAIEKTSSKLTAPEAQWDARQPDNIDYLRPTAMRFLIQTLPNVTYFCQSANIPEMSLGVAIQATPYIDLPHPGDKLNFGELTIKFMVQETMADYIELYNWLIGLGFPDDRAQYASYVASHNHLPSSGKNEAGQYSDASLLVLGSNNIPLTQITFYNCFPISLSGLEFDISNASTDYFQAQAVFKFQKYFVETVDI